MRAKAASAKAASDAAAKQQVAAAAAAAAGAAAAAAAAVIAKAKAGPDVSDYINFLCDLIYSRSKVCAQVFTYTYAPRSDAGICGWSDVRR